MSLELKRQRHRRFWQPPNKGEGGYLAVTSPIDDSGVAPYQLPEPSSLKEQWLSVEYALKKAEADCVNTYKGLDAVHSALTHIGPGILSALLGAEYVLQDTTVWFDTTQVIKTFDPMPDFEIDRGHELYKLLQELTYALCAASQDRYAVSLTDIGGQLDILYSIRGEDLMVDLIESPDEVLIAQTKLDKAFLEVYDMQNDIIKPGGCGYTNWIPALSDDPWYPIQCDISVMISPKMFETFVLPSLDMVSTYIGNSIYHLDGPGQIQHLDMVLSLKHVHAVQWVALPTAMTEAGVTYRDYADKMSFEVYDKVLKAGKKLVLAGEVEAFQVPEIFETIGCDGVFIVTDCKTRKEADELTAHAQKKWIKS